MTRLTLATANTPGAVAILQLHGSGVADTLRRLTGRDAWPERRAVLCGFAGIDEGLAVRLNDHAAQLMPHGGPRVVAKLIDHLTRGLGCAYDALPDPRAMYPEADSPIQADMLDAIARAASPAAIDLLAAQPTQWRALLQHGGANEAQRQAILERSVILDRLITPPTVVVVGPANVGKSTLTNTLMGRAVSIVADLPGTTRDWVGGLVELGWDFGIRDSGSSPHGHETGMHNPQSPTLNSHIAVQWLDTPGLRESGDPIEQRAIALARQQVAGADVLIAMRDADQPWPQPAALPRTPDLWVVNKMDDAGPPGDHDGLADTQPLQVSGAVGNNLDALQRRVVTQLGLVGIGEEPWAFSGVLRRWCGGDESNTLLQAYVGSV